MQEKRASEPLSIDQVRKLTGMMNEFFLSKFLSAFLLLILGTIASLFLLICEHIYVRYIRRAVTTTQKGGTPFYRKANLFSVLKKVSEPTDFASESQIAPPMFYWILLLS